MGINLTILGRREGQCHHNRPCRAGSRGNGSSMDQEGQEEGGRDTHADNGGQGMQAGASS